MAKVWTRIRQTIERRGSAALLSAVGAAGSVPRESGAASSCGRTADFSARSAAAAWNTRRLRRLAPRWRPGGGAAQFRDWPLGLNLGQWLPI
jgi:hypothetical protein